MNTKIIVGCDPGQEGAFFEIHPDGKKWSYEMPVVKWEERGKPKKKGNLGSLRKKKAYSVRLTQDYLFDVGTGVYDAVLFLEAPNFFSTSNNAIAYLSRQVASIESLALAAGIDLVKIKPKVWQQLIWENKDLVVDKKKSKGKKNPVIDPKATSLNAAVRLFPDQEWIYPTDVPMDERSSRKTKHHDGLVDAALIAYAGDMITSTGYVKQFQEWYDEERPWLPKPTTSSPVKAVINEIKKKWKNIK